MPSTRLKSFVAATALAAAALAGSAPAFAAPSGSQTKTILKYNAKMQKYCLTDPAVTGSRIATVTCKTAAAWTAAGLDMPKAGTVDASRLAQK
ncbi:MAG TPA: hypothetical protein VNJ10_00560 [Sphingomonas sp.]|nr:hypothetical protein [Sphingomonas sp.]